METDFEGLSAFETTQYFRGKLFIYVDFLLGSNNYTEEQIDAVNDFLYTVIRLIVHWLKKVPKLIPLVRRVSAYFSIVWLTENQSRPISDRRTNGRPPVPLRVFRYPKEAVLLLPPMHPILLVK